MTELAEIRNPLLRGIVGAIATSAAVTIAAGVVIGWGTNRESNAYRAGVYAVLAGAGVGAVLGLAAGQREPFRSQANAKTLDMTWNDWRHFVVVRKVQESAEITSFYLKPEDGKPIPSFQPGQFLTIRLDIPGQPRPVIRTYSLSDYAESPNYYRLSIKREPAPQNSGLPPGLASNFMHDQIQEGSIIPAKPPNGKFVLNVADSSPVVLISNGVGITPMVSMAKACAQLNPHRDVWFLHGARNGEFHAFRDEVMAIAQSYPNLRVHYCYSRPRSEDANHYQSEGYVNTDLIQTLIAPALQAKYGSMEADYFLCGSPAFMDSLRTGLQEWGVPGDRILFEAFSKPKAAPKPGISEESAIPGEAATGTMVIFEKTGKMATWTEHDGTLLEFAEEHGLNPAYSCRAGICLTCMCRLQEGEVTYDEPPTGTPDPGSVLICVSKPKGDHVVLDL
jgi:ferredoxin-NADP reductase